MLTSESVALTVTVTAPGVAAVGVPQTSRASLPRRPGESAPMASKHRPVAAWVMAPLPPVAAGTWNSVMAWPATKVMLETEPVPKSGAVSAFTVTENVSMPRSALWVLVSASEAVIVTVTAAAAVVGVPQISRAWLPGQPGESVPVASKRRPVGRLEAA